MRLISAVARRTLGTLRSWTATCCCATVAGDFRSCGQDLPADFVKTTVLDNTPIRWFYRAASRESAQWAAG
ncbi:hypothetical protein LNY53_29615 [Klebsiella pneumoniae]|nr:hypothetical protein [Klebsiella pneumoniae]